MIGQIFVEEPMAFNNKNMIRSLGRFAKAARSETGQKFHDIDAESVRLRKSNEDRNIHKEKGINLSRYDSSTAEVIESTHVSSDIISGARGAFIEKKFPSQTGVKWYRGILVRKVRSDLSRWEVKFFL